MTTTAAVPGAALYIARGKEVYMIVRNGGAIWIAEYASEKSAEAARERWQKKENAAVAKAGAK